jgi:hypothetical protein
MSEKKVEFEKWTTDDILDLLNCAMDDGEWHTPSASDIYIHTNNGFAIYGRCNISKHNTYHDAEYWFNINWYSVSIWKEEYAKGRANINHHRAIYNLQQLVEKLKKHSIAP